MKTFSMRKKGYLSRNRFVDGFYREALYLTLENTLVCG